MCWDKENGGTRELSLQLLTLGRLEVDSDNWLQFDTKNQEFVGVPLEGDVGREEYQLVCSDSEGYSAIDGIEVSTLSRCGTNKPPFCVHKYFSSSSVEDLWRDLNIGISATRQFPTVLETRTSSSEFTLWNRGIFESF